MFHVQLTAWPYSYKGWVATHAQELGEEGPDPEEPDFSSGKKESCTLLETEKISVKLTFQWNFALVFRLVEIFHWAKRIFFTLKGKARQKTCRSLLENSEK